MSQASKFLKQSQSLLSRGSDSEAKFAACKGLHSLGQGRDALDVWHAYGDETAETAIADLEKAIQDASAKPS